MLKIAHRGNTNGPNHLLENSPNYLLSAISQGYDVEVDVWVVGTSIYFGHDAPIWGEIGLDFLSELAPHAWFHCKNVQALEFFNTNYPKYRYFWHQDDEYTITSNGIIWVAPTAVAPSNSILVTSKLSDTPSTLYGACVDYV